jgi:hypothetical protein
MKAAASRRGAAPRVEAGYAILMAVFLVFSLMLIVTIATPSVLMQGRRQREDEAVWRGKQYVRAIHLYYQKNGRFPASLEDLTKPGPSNIHFLRKAYTDPMNRADGAWRPIYMAPSGQLVGSVRYHTMQEMAVAQGFKVSGTGSLAGALGQGAAQQTGTQQPAAQTGLGAQPSGAQPPGAQQGGPQQPSSTQPATQGAGGLSALSSSTLSNSASPGTPAPLQAVDGPVMGALVVGVGSKVKESSIRVYEGGETYFKWEFIWNPLATAAGQVAGAAGAAAGAAPVGAAPAAAGASTQQPANTTAPATSPSLNPINIPPLN